MQQQGERYLHAWQALGNILRDGGSWSGNERNCCFLNTRSERFADVSSVVGLDHASDSRAVAVVDWDHDGDLDLWFGNRTAPTIRLMRNNTDSANRYLAIRLRGTSSNRDAIGARVELVANDGRETLKTIQTLRAGEGYLAQSSKWLHFGLGKSESAAVRVRWPSGDQQDFGSLKANGRYLLVEGQQPKEIRSARSVQLRGKAPLAQKPRVDSGLRIIPHRRLPMPVVQLMDEAGTPFALKRDSEQLTLLSLWATWCQPCLAELQELNSRVDQLSKRGIRWLPVNVDDFESDTAATRANNANEFLDKAGISLRATLATRSAVECLDTVQRSLVTKQSDLAIPCSFLLDKAGRLMAVYKGTIDVEKLVADVDLLTSKVADPRDVAVPFPGVWGTNPFPPDLLAIPTGLMEISRWTESLEYLSTHVPTENFTAPITADHLAALYLQIGRQLASQEKDLRDAEAALLQAIKTKPTLWSARASLADVYLMLNRTADAIEQHRLALEVTPEQPFSLNNLAWLLATTPDESIRDPVEALRFAKQLCEKTKYGEPISLDAYAVALAANGEFDQAVEALRKAIPLAKSGSQSTERMEKRLQLFLANKPYIESRATGE